MEARIVAEACHGKSASDAGIKGCLASPTERRRRIGEAMVK